MTGNILSKTCPLLIAKDFIIKCTNLKKKKIITNKRPFYSNLREIVIISSIVALHISSRLEREGRRTLIKSLLHFYPYRREDGDIVNTQILRTIETIRIIVWCSACKNCHRQKIFRPNFVIPWFPSTHMGPSRM